MDLERIIAPNLLSIEIGTYKKDCEIYIPQERVLCIEFSLESLSRYIFKVKQSKLLSVNTSVLLDNRAQRDRPSLSIFDAAEPYNLLNLREIAKYRRHQK